MAQDTGSLADLQALGLSALGARGVYLALVRRDAWVTGYEIAKELGVARANVYDALRYLSRMGYAHQRANIRGTQYRAIPFTAVAETLLRELSDRVERIKEGLPIRDPLPVFWEGVGWTAFREQTASVLQQAVRTIQIGTSVEPIREAASIIDRFVNPEVEVAYGCWQGCPPSGCGVCREPIVPLRSWSAEPSCLIVVDDRLAVGSWGASEEPHVLTTTYPAVVAGWRALLLPPASA